MNFTPSRRLQKIDASGIRRAFDLGASLSNPIDMSIGQPDFTPPDFLIGEAEKALREGHNRYTPTQGDPDLIKAISLHLEETRDVPPDDLFIIAGVSAGIYLTFQVLLDPGDEVILPDPYFVMYKHLAHLVDAKPIYLDTYPDFTYPTRKLEDAVTPRTKLIVLNSPSNPTGKVMNTAEVERVIEVAERQDSFLLSDEIYENFLYDTESLPSPYGRYAKTILLNGFSKSLGVTGWRLGYVAGPREVLQEMKKLQQYTFVCASSTAQRAALSYFSSEGQSFARDRRDTYRRKRDIFYREIKNHFACQPSEGAFYAFLPAPDENGDRFAQKASEKNLLVVPGSIFSEQKSHFRVSFASDEEKIKKGAEILRSLATG